MHKVTIHISDDLYYRAVQLAKLTSRDVSDILTDTLDLSLGQFLSEEESQQSIKLLSDDKVREIAHSMMAKQEADRMKNLSDKRAAGDLSDIEKGEIATLLSLYQQGLLRKAQALREAKERGLLDGIADG